MPPTRTPTASSGGPARTPTLTAAPTDAPTEAAPPAGAGESATRESPTSRPPESVLEPTDAPSQEGEAVEEPEQCESMAEAEIEDSLAEAAEQSAQRSGLFFRYNITPSIEPVWLACDETAASNPDGELCLPRAQVPAGSDDTLRLTACSTALECAAYRLARATEGEVCFEGDRQGKPPRCDHGCMVYHEQRNVTAAPIFVISGGLILVGVVGAGVISRRNRNAAEDSEEGDLSR